MSWEDVPMQGDLAYQEGYALGDCPYPHGSADGHTWRTAWIAYDHQADFLSGEREEREQEVRRVAAAYAQAPETREVDELIDSFGEPKVPSMPILRSRMRGWLQSLIVPPPTVVLQSFKGQSFKGLSGFSIGFDIDKPDAPDDALSSVSGTGYARQTVPIPKSATSYARGAVLLEPSGPQGIQPDDRLDRQLSRQLMLEEYARQRSLQRTRDLFRGSA